MTDEGVIARAAVPSGASTGEHEAVELRDGGSGGAAKASRALLNLNADLAAS